MTFHHCACSFLFKGKSILIASVACLSVDQCVNCSISCKGKIYNRYQGKKCGFSICFHLVVFKIKKLFFESGLWVGSAKKGFPLRNLKNPGLTCKGDSGGLRSNPDQGLSRCLTGYPISRKGFPEY